MTSLHGIGGCWHGTCGFRMMPTDELAVAPSTAETSTEAAGHGWLLRYTWTHADDGEQHGTLLVGSPVDDGTISAGWIDSWHQQPELRLLTGSVVGDVLRLEMEYEGWGWIIELVASGNRFGMLMSNVIPDGIDGAEPGPYVVMEARWERAS